MKRVSTSILLLSSLSWTYVGQATNTSYFCQADCYVNIKMRSRGGDNPLARAIREAMKWTSFTDLTSGDDRVDLAWKGLVQQCVQTASEILNHNYGSEYYLETSMLVHRSDEQNFSAAKMIDSCTR